MRCAGLLVLAACGAAPATKPAKPPTASEIVDKLRATYKALPAYVDHGVVTNGNSTRSWETMFVRDARFRFSLADENDPERGFVLWADPTHAYTRWYGPPHTTDDGPALDVALAVTASPSYGVATTLAELLRMHYDVREPTLDGEEPVDDEPCWIISGKRNDTDVRLWIDRKTFLLRRTAEDGRVATFRPTVGAKPAVDDVPAPDFSDDYAEASEAMIKLRALVGQRAPAFAAGTTTLAGLAGKVVLVDFWATWCGPCRTTIPRLNDLHDRLAAKGLAVVGLSSEDPAVVTKFATEHAIRYALAHDKDGAIAHAYNANALPMLVVIDRAGVVKYVTLGAGEIDKVEAVVDSLAK